MKAYVIKNKEGRYFQWSDLGSGKNHFSTKPIKFMAFNKEIDAKRMKKFFGLKDCTIVPITISEGDLEDYIESIEKINDELTEERYIFKKALKLACEAYYDIDCCPYCLYGTGKENLGGEELIQEIAKHFIQKAKESEKDDDI